MDTGAVFYGKQDHTYILKFVGDIRYTLGYSLDTFLNRLFEKKDFDDILIDLTETTAIDSTSLGLLAKVANFMRDRFDKKTTIISSNEDVNQVLDSVDFYEVFTICEECRADVGGAKQLPISQAPQEEMAKTLLDAHNVLSELSEDNRIRFKDVVEALKEELAPKN